MNGKFISKSNNMYMHLMFFAFERVIPTRKSAELHRQGSRMGT